MQPVYRPGFIVLAICLLALAPLRSVLAGDGLFPEIPKAKARFSEEQVLAMAPEVIIVTTMSRDAGSREAVERWTRWPNLPAVKKGRVYLVDSNLFDRPSPRLVDALELLVVTGRGLAHSLAMMVPEAWASKTHLRPNVKGFFEYHATMMEPWDGPANIVVCDGRQIVAILDRNGLRPARYWITSDDEIIYASEAGVLDIAPEKILRKERLAPGKMILVDVETGEFKEDHEIKGELASAEPYASWVNEYLIRLDDLPAPATKRASAPDKLKRKQGSFGYTLEEMREIMAPMALNGQEPVGSMGTDTPVAVLSKHSKLLYWYFKQLFAQITNPPIDPLREEIVMSLTQYIGPARNILMPGPEHCRMLEIDHPIITNDVLEQLRHSDIENFRGTTLSTLFSVEQGPEAMGQRLEALFVEAEAAVDAGRTMLVLSDRGVDAERAPIPALLALSSIHHHLIRVGKRSQCSLIVETGEAREVHHFALLVGYGAAAINPYLAFQTLQDMVNKGMLPSQDGNTQADEETDVVHQYTENYIKAIGKGLLKIFSKMGISTLQSYCGAQIFEIIGLNEGFTAKYFPGTASRIGGAGLNEIAMESLMRHRIAFARIEVLFEYRDRSAPVPDGRSSFAWLNSMNLSDLLEEF